VTSEQYQLDPTIRQLLNFFFIGLFLTSFGLFGLGLKLLLVEPQTPDPAIL
jgi:hypothetical protein